MRLSGKLKDSLDEASQTTRAKHTFTLTSVSQSPPHERCSLASKDIFFSLWYNRFWHIWTRIYHKIIKVRKIRVFPRSLPIGREMGNTCNTGEGERKTGRGRKDLEAPGNLLFPIERSQKMAANVLPTQQARNSCLTDMVSFTCHDLCKWVLPSIFFQWWNQSKW